MIISRQLQFGITVLIGTCLPASVCVGDDAPSVQTVLIKGETYVMGNDLPKRDRKHHEDEPRIEVTVRDFRIGKRRVTAAKFCDFLNSTTGQGTSNFPALYHAGAIGRYHCSTLYRRDKGDYVPKPGQETRPANQVTWQGAMEFCQWLSRQTGKTYRLPTEAEWELAARRRADELNMCKGWVGEWCINRWVARPEADDMTNALPHLDDLSSERSIRGQHKWKKRSWIPFPFSNNSMHGPRPWTRQYQQPHDIQDAAWYGFRIAEEIEDNEKPNQATATE